MPLDPYLTSENPIYCDTWKTGKHVLPRADRGNVMINLYRPAKAPSKYCFSQTHQFQAVEIAVAPHPKSRVSVSLEQVIEMLDHQGNHQPDKLLISSPPPKSPTLPPPTPNLQMTLACSSLSSLHHPLRNRQSAFSHYSISAAYPYAEAVIPAGKLDSISLTFLVRV